LVLLAHLAEVGTLAAGTDLAAAIQYAMSDAELHWVSNP
jgi:hypothetical protein